MDYGLKGRVVLVTGSSRGIGRAIATSFGREGTHVAVTYHNDREGADDIAATIRDAGGEALVTSFDLASETSIHDAVDEVLDRWGQIDVLVNNAVAWGSTPPAQAPPFEELSTDEWQPLLCTNVEGAFTMIQAVVPSMREQSWGRIVNISSGVAVDGLPGASWYAAAKASLHGLTRTLTKDSHEGARPRRYSDKCRDAGAHADRA